MVGIRARRSTWIKAKPVSSNYLTSTEKVWIKSGERILVDRVIPDRHQHYAIAVEGKIQFIYSPHWDLPKRKEVKLEVPYFYQRDNWTKYHGPGGRQCNLTSHCMAADYLLKGKITREAKDRGYWEPEDLYGKVLYRYGDTTNPTAHTPTFRHFGLDSYFTYTGSIKDLILCLDHGIPVPLGVAYKVSGHYVCAVGHNPHGVYIHDPFGIRMGQTDNYSPEKGDYDFVTWDWLQAKWVDQGSEAGWMRVVVAVNGEPTGVPRGL